MTEYNYFCWSNEINSESSFQQKRYRIFNVEVGIEEYDKVKKLYRKLEMNTNEDYSTSFQTAFKKMWNTLTPEEQQEYFDIPHFDKVGFEFITGIGKEEEGKAEEKTVERIVTDEDGKKYKLVPIICGKIE